MSIERVSATAVVPGSPQRHRGEPPVAAAGGAVEAPDEHFEGSARWRLEAVGEASRRLHAGDVVQVRVLSTAPRLELELLPQVAPARREGRTDLRAMRLDQAALRQVHWHMPDAASLMGVWRVLLRAHALRHGVGPAGLSWPTALPETLPGREALARAEATVHTASRELVPGADAGAGRWVLPVFAWGGLSVTLHLRLLEERRRQARPGEREAGLTVLEVALHLPGLGPLRLRLQWVGTGLVLSAAPAEAAALDALQPVWPHLREALGNSPWPVVGCRLEPTLPALGTVPTPAGARPVVSSALLGAAAEAVSFLAQRWPARLELVETAVSPANPRY